MPDLLGTQRRVIFTFILGLHTIICGVIIGAGFIYFANTTIQAAPLLYWLCVISTFLYVWLFYSRWLINGEVFDPYGLFLLAAILFNGGQIVLESFGLNLDGILHGKFESNTLIKSIYLVDCGLAFFHLGALLGPVSSTPSQTNVSSVQCHALRKVGFGLILLAIIPIVLQFVEAMGVVFSGGYGALYEREAAVGLNAAMNVLSAFIIPGAIFLLAGSDGRTIHMKQAGFLIVLYSVIQFFLGYRGWATMPLIAYAWLWHNTIRPLPKHWIYSIGVALVFIVFPLIAAVRNLSGNERSVNNLHFAITSIENPAVAAISEMGESLRTVAYTLELVPSFRDFDWGIGYLYALLTVVPNVWEGVHPTVARGLPSRWLTETVEPIIAEQGGGLGYSFIAEAYLNFGWIGAPIVLFIFGFIFVKLVSWSVNSGSNVRMAMIASFISFSLYFARGELSGVVRQLIWYSFIPYVCVMVLSRRSQRDNNL